MYICVDKIIKVFSSEILNKYQLHSVFLLLQPFYELNAHYLLQKYYLITIKYFSVLIGKRY